LQNFANGDHREIFTMTLHFLSPCLRPVVINLFLKPHKIETEKISRHIQACAVCFLTIEKCKVYGFVRKLILVSSWDSKFNGQNLEKFVKNQSELCEKWNEKLKSIKMCCCRGTFEKISRHLGCYVKNSVYILHRFLRKKTCNGKFSFLHWNVKNPEKKIFWDYRKWKSKFKVF